MTGLSLSADVVAEAPAHGAAVSRVSVERLVLPLVVALALAASLTSLANGYAYDDVWIVATNARVHSLDAWWQLFAQSYWPPEYNQALYRPLVVLAFAIEWAIGGGKPWVFHLANVLLYAAVCAGLFRFARLFVPALPAAVAAALFAVHPVHVEAVGNVVGQAELLVALVFLVAMSQYVRWRREGPLGWPRIGALTLLYLLACLMKEHGIVLVALLAALEATVVRDERPWRARFAQVRPLLLTLVAVALAFVWVRSLVLGGMAGDNPHPAFVGMSNGARLATVVGSLVPEWARLLVWPARLAADYSPHDLAVHDGFGVAALRGIAILAGALLLLVLAWRRLPLAAFGLLMLAITLAPASNVLFASGVMIAERTLFLPSAGLLLALAAAIPALLPHLTRTRAAATLSLVALVALLAAGTAHSAARQRTWNSTRDVFATLVADAPLNYRAQFGWGNELFNQGLHAQGERHLRAAIQLFPKDVTVAFDLADRYQRNRMYAQSAQLFAEVVRLAPDRPDARAMLVFALLQLQRYEEARDHAIIGLRSGQSTAAFRVLLARAYRGVRDPRAGTGVLEGIGGVVPQGGSRPER